MLHTIDPVLLHLVGPLAIRWYGLAYLAAFIAGFLWIRAEVRRGRVSGMTVEKVGDFVFAVAIGTLIGGRLGYCIFYEPKLLWSFESAPPYWSALALHRGGMASHGGIVGLMVACWWWGKRHRVHFLTLTDLTVVAGALGIFLGRLANFVNGELLGRVAPPGTSFTVKFPHELYLWEPAELRRLEPVAAALGVTPTTFSATITRGGGEVSAFLSSVISAVQDGNLRVQAALEPLLAPRYPSQIYGALLEGLLPGVILFVVARRWQPRAGVLSAIFVTVYPIMRILSEQFRLPDPQIGFQWLGLTRGQWLSIAMTVAGAIFVWQLLRSRRPAA